MSLKGERMTAVLASLGLSAAERQNHADLTHFRNQTVRSLQHSFWSVSIPPENLARLWWHQRPTQHPRAALCSRTGPDRQLIGTHLPRPLASVPTSTSVLQQPDAHSSVEIDQLRNQQPHGCRWIRCECHSWPESDLGGVRSSLHIARPASRTSVSVETSRKEALLFVAGGTEIRQAIMPLEGHMPHAYSWPRYQSPLCTLTANTANALRGSLSSAQT
jgi:hypothetical protein